MIRKQVYLTEELDRQIALTAVSEHKPGAEMIREVLHAGFAQKLPKANAGEALLGLANLAPKSDDPYLSRNIDKYLYEDA